MAPAVPTTGGERLRLLALGATAPTAAMEPASAALVVAWAQREEAVAAHPPTA
jgi:hypothetical protein